MAKSLTEIEYEFDKLWVDKGLVDISFWAESNDSEKTNEDKYREKLSENVDGILERIDDILTPIESNLRIIQ